MSLYTWGSELENFSWPPKLNAFKSYFNLEPVIPAVELFPVWHRKGR